VGKVDPWGTWSADPELGIVYVPTGMPLMDEYGGLRPGDNLYGNSLVAIDVKTGKRKWHFQMVHHDIWDYDTPMAPNLVDITVNGKRRKAIAQTTKQGWVYTFDRETGEPIWPMPETPVLQSDVPQEQTSKTQPIPSKPEPFSQQGLVEADLIDYTPAIKDSALKLAQKCRMGPYYNPRLGDRRHEQAQMLVVRARREWRREHRRRRRGGSRDRNAVRRVANGHEHDPAAEGSVLGVPLQLDP
jgi:quinoprotein glucose dehydrogenase